MLNDPKVEALQRYTKTSLNSVGKFHGTWEAAAQNPTTWYTTPHKGAATYEASKTLAAEQRYFRTISEMESSPEMKIH